MSLFADEAIVANFRRDLRVHLLAWLDSIGAELPVPNRIDVELVVRAFFNMLRRLPLAVHRAVHRSRELEEALSGPHAAERAVVEVIIRRARAGITLRPFLHRPIKRADYDDMFLNDWGILHFHLGGDVPMGKDQLVARSDALLLAFACERTGALYFLGIRPHANAWTDRSVLESLLQNWPAVIATFRSTIPAPRDGSDVTDDELKTIRRKGGVVPTQLSDGNLYYPPGGGYQTSGLSTKALVGTDFLLNFVEQHQRELEGRADEILAAVVDAWPRALSTAMRHDLLAPSSVRLRLRILDEGLEVVVDPWRMRLTRYTWTDIFRHAPAIARPPAWVVPGAGK